MKKLSITFLILMFFSFFIYQTQKSVKFKVLKIITPTQIVVDLNNNSIVDKNETFLLEKIDCFSSKPSKEQTELAKRLKISNEDSLALGFLTENFAKEALDRQNVKLKNNSIILNNKNYQNLIVERGFALKKGKAPSKQFIQNLEKAKKLNLVILNNKNHKYHKLSCKYGLAAHNSQIIPASQLSKDATPCKFCFSKRYKKTEEINKKNIDKIPNIQTPKTVFQTGNIKIFLTDMTKVLKPSNNCNTPICKTLLEEINSAQNSIDFAIYGYTKIPILQKALENAQSRGVKIRLIYDTDDKNNNIYPDTLYLSKIFINNKSDLHPKLMHNKFFIFDNKKVLTGSANISNTDMSGFNSNVVILINSNNIANIYAQEFEQMFSGKFHKAKIQTNFENNSDLSVYFSPQDLGIQAIIPLINSAQKYVYIPAFLITHKGLTDALIEASKRGVNVKIILDATNTHSGSHSKINYLRKNKIQVKTENYAGKLHSKSIIIDDRYTIIGSMNFSNSGNNINDENLIIIKNKEIARFYKVFFQYLWQRIPDKWLYKNAHAESPDSIGSCSDGIDNDFDGKVDKSDESCKLVTH